MKHTNVKVRMTQGISQGDPNAQSLFVMTYEEFEHDIDEQRAHLLKMDFDVPKYLLPELAKYRTKPSAYTNKCMWMTMLKSTVWQIP